MSLRTCAIWFLRKQTFSIAASRTEHTTRIELHVTLAGRVWPGEATPQASPESGRRFRCPESLSFPDLLGAVKRVILTRPVLSPQAFIYCLISDAPGPLQAELLPLVFWFLGISDAPGTLQATPGIQAELMPLVFWSRLSYCP